MWQQESLEGNSMDYKQLEQLNNANHRKLSRNCAIQIRDVIPDRTAGGKFMVKYADYSTRSNDEASLQDIIDYLKWEEKYITNIGALAKCYEDPEEDGDYLEEEDNSKWEGELHMEDLSEALQAKLREIGATVERFTEYGACIRIRINGEAFWYTESYILKHL